MSFVEMLAKKKNLKCFLAIFLSTLEKKNQSPSCRTYTRHFLSVWEPLTRQVKMVVQIISLLVKITLLRLTEIPSLVEVFLVALPGAQPSIIMFFL